jgi:hypothetical protein
LPVPPDQVLDHAKGRYLAVVVVGETEGGGIEVAGSNGAAESVLLLGWAKMYLVQNSVHR